MKRIEFFKDTQTVVIYLDENIKNAIDAYQIAWKMLIKEIVKNEPRSSSHPNW